MKQEKKGQLMWFFLLIGLLLKGLLLLGHFMDWHIKSQFPWINIIGYLCIGIAIFMHLFIAQGRNRALGLMLYTCLWGFIGEYLVISNGEFQYHINTTYILDTVPLLLPLAWFFITYVIYSYSSLLSYSLLGELPSYKNHSLQFVAFLILIDAIILTGYMLIADPVGHEMKIWTWQVFPHDLTYMNIPLRIYNYYFFGVIILMLPFRLYEYYNPIQIEMTRSHQYFTLLLVISIFFTYEIFAFQIGLYAVGIWGLLLISLLLIIGFRTIAVRKHLGKE